MAPRHVPGLSHSVLPPYLQPMVGPCFSLGRSSPIASIQACCCNDRCLYHRLGGHVQRACSCRGSGQGPGCSGISIALSYWQYGLLCAASKCCYTRRMYWSVQSLRAVHVPGELNRAAAKLSHQPALPGEWQLLPEVLQLIWRRFGDAQVDLFASPDMFHCQLFFSLSEGTLGTDALAHSWSLGLRKYAFPPVSLLAQTLCKVREDEEQVLLVRLTGPIGLGSQN